MNFSASSLFASLIFSGVGLIALRRGKGEGNIPLAIIGVLLMGYSYFTKTPLMDWGIGFALSGGVYYFWHY